MNTMIKRWTFVCMLLLCSVHNCARSMEYLASAVVWKWCILPGATVGSKIFYDLVIAPIDEIRDGVNSANKKLDALQTQVNEGCKANDANFRNIKENQLPALKTELKDLIEKTGGDMTADLKAKFDHLNIAIAGLEKNVDSRLTALETSVQALGRQVAKSTEQREADSYLKLKQKVTLKIAKQKTSRENLLAAKQEFSGMIKEDAEPFAELGEISDLEEDPSQERLVNKSKKVEGYSSRLHKCRGIIDKYTRQNQQAVIKRLDEQSSVLAGLEQGQQRLLQFVDRFQDGGQTQTRFKPFHVLGQRKLNAAEVVLYDQVRKLRPTLPITASNSDPVDEK